MVLLFFTFFLLFLLLIWSFLGVRTIIKIKKFKFPKKLQVEFFLNKLQWSSSDLLVIIRQIELVEFSRNPDPLRNAFDLFSYGRLSRWIQNIDNSSKKLTTIKENTNFPQEKLIFDIDRIGGIALHRDAEYKSWIFMINQFFKLKIYAINSATADWPKHVLGDNTICFLTKKKFFFKYFFYFYFFNFYISNFRFWWKLSYFDGPFKGCSENLWQTLPRFFPLLFVLIFHF